MKTLLSSLLVVGLFLGVAGVNGAIAAEKKPNVINIGSAGGGYGKPFSTGIIGTLHTKGLLEEEFRKDGIKINWYFFKGAGPAVNESVANGNLDFAYIGDFPAIIGKATGLKTKYIANNGLGDIHIMVPSDSNITSIKDLKGKRIGLFKGTNSQPVLYRILEENGLTPEKDVKIFNLQSLEIEAALASKDIDAGVAGLRIRDTGLAKVLFSTNPKIKAIIPNKSFSDKWRPIAGFIVTDKFANEYPEITKRVVKAYFKAARWGAEEKNRNELFRLWAQSGTPYSVLKEQIQGRDQKYFNKPLIDEFFTNHLKEVLAFTKEKKYVRTTFDVDKWVDTSYQDAALKELGLENHWPRYDANGKKKK